MTAVNTFTKIYLCSLGQYDYNAVPAVPPEIILFPNWFYFNIYEISSWSRAILVPLSVAYAKKPFKKIPPEQGIDELFVGGRKKANLHLKWDRKHLIGWRNFFLALDRITHWFERIHIRPLRKMALKRAEKWLLERLGDVGRAGRDLSRHAECDRRAGLPGIHPGRSAVHPRDGRVRAAGHRQARTASRAIPTPTFRMQPCMSPVWDTAQAVYALGEAGVAEERSAAAEGGGLAALQGGAPQGRLGEEHQGCGPGRLVLRVQQ